MNHRIVSAVIGGVLLLFCGAALLFALGVTPSSAAPRKPGARPLPHELDAPYATCRECHQPGGAAPALPPTHRSFGAGDCTACHHVQ